MNSDSSRVVPTDIEVKRSSELRVAWSDGREDVLPLALVRRACPCATCREQRADDKRAKSTSLAGGGGLPIMPSGATADTMTRAASAELVGSYALRIVWADGHNAGIYDFAYLRELAQDDPVG